MVASIADKVAVMYAGEIVEFGKVEEIFYDPKHPYTWSLLSSLPQLSTSDGDLYSIPGTPPSLYAPIKGDAFALRSDYAMQIDFEEEAPAFKVTDTHWAKTWLLHPDAPTVHKPCWQWRNKAPRAYLHLPVCSGVCCPLYRLSS